MYAVITLELVIYIQFFFQLQRLLDIKLVRQGFSKNVVSPFKKCIGRYQNVVEKYCHLRTDNERWYWKLEKGSKLTIASLLCLTTVGTLPTSSMFV
jgi:hypothetical protein